MNENHFTLFTEWQNRSKTVPLAMRTTRLLRFVVLLCIGLYGQNLEAQCPTCVEFNSLELFTCAGDVPTGIGLLDLSNCPPNIVVANPGTDVVDTPIAGTGTGYSGSPMDITRTYTFTDNAPAGGGPPVVIGTCSHLIRLESTPLGISNPPDVTVTLASGECGKQVFFDAPVALGACGTGTVTQTGGPIMVSGAVFPQGVTMLTYTATSTFPGSPTLTQDVVITVIENPNANNQMACGDPNISVDEICSVTLSPGDVLTGTNYGCFDSYSVSLHACPTCPALIVFDGTNTFDASNYIDQEIVVKVTGPAPLNNSCWNYRLIEDKLGPTITGCDPGTVVCGASTLPGAPGIPLPTANDNCEGAITPTYTDQISGTNCLTTPYQTITRTWTATDSKGNTATCEQVITITRPTLAIGDIDCPDNFDGLVGNPAPIACNSGYPTDANGHPSPTLTGEPLYLTQKISEMCMYNVVYNDQVIPDMTCAANSTYIRTWTILNMCNSEIFTCTQIIKVVDNVGPVITCPDNTTLPVGSNCTAASVLPAPTMVDACSNNNNTYTATKTGSGTLTQLSNGNYVITNLPVNATATITYTPYDACGNPGATCSFTVTAEDNQAPVANCVAPTTGLNGNDSQVFAASFNNNSTDNCGIVSYQVRKLTDCGVATPTAPFGPSVTFKCCEAATIVMVELKVTDAAGNSNICQVPVTVQNNIIPTITCPAGSPVGLSCENLSDLDNYPGVGPVNTGIEAYYEENGVQTFVGYYDASLVSMGCFAKVVISDSGSPDECGTGTITRTYRAENSTGNFTSCTYIYTVTNPTPFNGLTDITWPTNTVVTVTAGCVGDTSAAVTGAPIVNRVIGCDKTAVGSSDLILFVNNPPVGGTCYKVMRTWTVSNWCPIGTSANFTDPAGPQIIEVINTVAPTITCSTNAVSVNEGTPFTVSSSATTCDPTGTQPGATFTYQIANTTNNIFGAPISGSALLNEPTGSNTNFPEGNYIVRFTAKDACNNVSTCDIPVEVVGVLDCNDVLEDAALQPVDVGSGNDIIITPDLFFASGSVPANVTVNVPNQTAINCGDIVNNAPTDLPVEVILPGGIVCNRTLVLIDNISPLLSCKNSETINGLPSINVADYLGVFINSVSDNCTPTADINITFSPATLNCIDGVAQPVVITATDDFQHGIGDPSNGNPISCTVNVTLNCSTPPGTMSIVSGSISNESNSTVENVSVTPASGMAQAMTNANGTYSLNLATSENYDVTPEKDDDYLNGVSTYDIVLMSKHILQVQPLNSPYKLIAADVNKSGGVTTLDMVELRKVILFINDEFPNNTSWRFVDANYVFPNASNPFEEIFPESYAINGLAGDMADLDFVAVKIGDVNGSATTNGFSADADDRDFRGSLDLEVKDASLKAGQTHTIEVTANDFNNLLGYQFTMAFEGLEVMEVTPGELTSLTAANFGMQRLNEGMLTTSWNNNDAVSLADGTVLFTITVKATTDVNLSDVLHATSHYTAAEAYADKAGVIELLDVNLNFRDNNGVTIANTFELYQNRPNPFKDETVIGFDLPEAGVATISVYDLSGRVLAKVEGTYGKGYNEVSINRSDLPGAGVLYYELATERNSAVRKMTIIE